MNILELSSKFIDSQAADEPTDRITQELSEVGTGIAVVESFSHMIAFATTEGLVLIDAGGSQSAGDVLLSLRAWSGDPVHTLIYTHGHLDHVGGSGALAEDARGRGNEEPEVVGHRNLLARFERYRRMNGWNQRINRRQFGGGGHDLELGGDDAFLPKGTLEPSTVVDQTLELQVGERQFVLNHAKGETDDHLWVWEPDARAVMSGDLFCWIFPNVGNPQKVQRHPEEWASALRAMVSLSPELLLPSHGLPVQGRQRIRRVLLDVATVLETLVEDVIGRMNAGMPLHRILREVRVDPDMLRLPWLRPVYDEPEFAIRNIWRKYGGWWDGQAATLHPPAPEALGAELARLAGGVWNVMVRARELSAKGDYRLASQLIDYAYLAAPDDDDIKRARYDIYTGRWQAATSLMAKGIYADTARSTL